MKYDADENERVLRGIALGTFISIVLWGLIILAFYHLG